MEQSQTHTTQRYKAAGDVHHVDNFLCVTKEWFMLHKESPVKGISKSRVNTKKFVQKVHWQGLLQYCLDGKSTQRKRNQKSNINWYKIELNPKIICTESEGKGKGKNRKI